MATTSKAAAPSASPRAAASVILLRTQDNGFEVLLLRRHRRASFMSNAFVFPGGAVDPDEDDHRLTAIRELFEEAGVLLTTSPVSSATRQKLRSELTTSDTTPSFPDRLRASGTDANVNALHYYSHWITPSLERKRFSATFFVAIMPDGQTVSFDNQETVDMVWITPQQALARAKELQLPPPQVRTFGDLAGTTNGITGVMADAGRRAHNRHAILPRVAPAATGFSLLLPWDPEYLSHGQGEHVEVPTDNPFATGPSRFILEDKTWKNVYAPGSPTKA